MNIPSNRRTAAIGAVPVTALWAICGVATPVGAQDAMAPAQCPPDAVGVSTRQGADPAADEAIRMRVQTALHSNEYFYDEHVTVTMEHGNIVLHGFVFSDWDLHDALQIAKDAACHRRVIDLLSIKVGGRK